MVVHSRDDDYAVAIDDDDAGDHGDCDTKILSSVTGIEQLTELMVNG